VEVEVEVLLLIYIEGCSSLGSRFFVIAVE
jgi:hypothetical protein